ncbi:MAG: bacillithiol biosynthesis cysteine-adding enzyme BshC [Gracilimonas sp.]|nr:bacillithiol biosynthesis cysteine-adding enzyme BshC [Gracilimonas sp.]
MDISGCSFSELSYSKLFTTYLDDFDKLSSFYSYNPFLKTDVQRRAEDVSGTVNRKKLIDALSDYHNRLGIAEDQSDQLNKLSQSDALAVVTGQQLGMYGGPVFTIYKTLTAIALANKYEKELGRPVVPVFWMADEDHDFDEISWTGIAGRDNFAKIELKQTGKDIPVFNEVLDDTLERFRENVKDEMFDTDFSKELWRIIDQHYQEGRTHGEAFAGFINNLFANEGVLIAGSNHNGLKKLLADDLAKSISSADAVYKAIEEKSTELESAFHRQVINGDSNLFYLNEDSKRIKIHRDVDKWTAENKIWSTDDLVKDIEEKPESFSPNVFLRPIIQDRLLPTLGYVSGPGELAYYGQMRSFYGVFGLEMPLIIPRYTATIIESGISRILEKLPFKVCEYDQRIEDLESAYVEQTDNVDLEEVFDEWKEKLEEAAEKPLKVIDDIDPTLDGTVGKTVAGFENELNKLKGKVYRSIKQQEETQLKRIEKIKINLFPDGGLQERSVSPIYFMNKYGTDIWHKMLEEMIEQGVDLTKHHLIEL